MKAISHLCLQWISKCSKILNFCNFQKFDFSKFEHDFSVIWVFRNRESILSDIEKLTFVFWICVKNFEIFNFLLFLMEKWPKKNIFAKVSLSSEKQINIWMKTIEDIYRLKNEHEQIHSFVYISNWKSCQLTKMSANLRNSAFSKKFRLWNTVLRTMSHDDDYDEIRPN